MYIYIHITMIGSCFEFKTFLASEAGNGRNGLRTTAQAIFSCLVTADCSLFGSILMFDALFDANKGFVSS